MRREKFRLTPRFENCERRELLATLPPGFVETPVVPSGLSFPTALEVARDGSVFISEKGGSLRIVQNDSLRAAPVLSLPVNTTGERGLIGFALDYGPADTTNPEGVFVYYTTPDPTPHNRLSRFALTIGGTATGPEQILLDLPPSTASNHNGGPVRVGTDGKLYLAVGDHGTAANAQGLDNLFGKILRLNQDGSIPTDNPLLGFTTGPNRAIWALGLRNPFGMELDPTDGRFFIHDAGSNQFEEVNVGAPGSNYGWPTVEGPSTDPRFVPPLFAYPTRGGEDSVIVGGAIYSSPNPRFPAEYTGDLFAADFSGGIRAIDTSNGQATPFLTDGDTFLIDLATATDGSLYVLNYGLRSNPAGTGSLSRITFTQSNDPTPKPGLAEPPADFDGDGRSDLAVYRPTNGHFLVGYSGGGGLDFAFDQAVIGEPVPADYDGDGTTDFAVFRPSSPDLPGAADWTIRLSSTGQESTRAFGGANIDEPVPADYDGDGVTDLAVYRRSTAEWLILGSRDGARVVPFGFAGVDLPVPADYDGDGRADLTTFRPSSDLVPGASHWFALLSAGGVINRPFGQASADVPIPGDYDGDDRADMAVYRPATAETFILGSLGPAFRVAGPASPAPSLVPIAQDFDGDGRLDVSIYDQIMAHFALTRTTLGSFNLDFGQPGVDLAIHRLLARRNLLRIRSGN